MGLYLCLDCAVIYDCDEFCERVCPRCGKLLGLRQEEPDNAPSLMTKASEALHGPAPKREPRWKIG